MDPLNCSCDCGSARFTITGEPLGRFMCHCTICQSVYRAPFADAIVLAAGNVPREAVEHVRFERHRPPPAVQRGRCRSCGQPVVAYMNVAPGFTLAFVPVARYPRGIAPPDPGMHIHYDSRVADVDDDLPRFSGYWRSQFAVLRMVWRAVRSNRHR
jgi:hypothetical protein